MSFDRRHETLVPISQTEIDAAGDCTPTKALKGFADVSLDVLRDLGVSHVLVDVDGVLVASRQLFQGPNDSIRERLAEIVVDSRFTLSLATENGNPPEHILDCLGLPEGTTVFEPFESTGEWLQKTSDRFWMYIGAMLGIRGQHGNAVMIGDNPARDIAPAKRNGFKTVQLDRLTYTEPDYFSLLRR